MNICILGKPNAGKSSLVNTLIGRNKIIVSDIPGTTRDAIDVELVYSGKNFNLIDTAGLKRPGRTRPGIEKFSMLRCLKAIERSEIIVLLIDGREGISSQDTHIAAHALEAEKGLIIAINKIDLFDNEIGIHNAIVRKLRRKFSFIPWAPVVFISAKNKKNTQEILKLAEQIDCERKKRITTAELNSFLRKTTQKHRPSSKFMYASQVDINPPKFVFFFKNPSNLHFSYPRYLENEIRKEYGFNGTSIEMRFKASKNVHR